MVRRRELLIGAGAAALGACASKLGDPAAPSAAAHWPPYRQTVSIDGAGGIWLIYSDDTPADEVRRQVAAELAHARASGLSAVVLTTAPQGRFWLNDAAFEKTQRDLAAWSARIAEHPEAVLRVDSAADLETARRSQRLGIVCTFQGTEPLGEDADRIPMFRQLGVRVMQLTHNRRNLVGDGCMEPSRRRAEQVRLRGRRAAQRGELAICDSGYTIAVLSNLDPPAASRIADFIKARLPAK